MNFPMKKLTTCLLLAVALTGCGKKE